MRVALMVLSALMGVAALSALSLPQQESDAGSIDALRKSTLNWCGKCHRGNKAKAGFDLERLFEIGGASAYSEQDRIGWLQTAVELVDAEYMPPRKAAQPPIEQRRLILDGATRLLDHWMEMASPVLPAVTVRRLSHDDYRRTIRDLLGIVVPVSMSLPDDDLAYGFDNIGDVLSVSSLLLERYMNVAEWVCEEVFATREAAAGYLAADPGEGSPVERAMPVFADFLERAWRRPPNEQSIQHWTSYVARRTAAGAPFRDVMKEALVGVLVSPRFLFRAELLPDPDAGPRQPLDGWEVASRLSYFLWGTIPDAELYALARTGELTDLQVLMQQADRLLEDERAVALSQGFASQWLRLHDLTPDAIDRELFPAVGEARLANLEQESLRLFDAVLRNRRPATELLTADYTFVNSDVASHYGIAGVEGLEFRRVSLDQTPRRGILSHASVLTATSYSTRTSPTLRGNWVLDVLLDDETSAPMNVPNIEDESRMENPLSLREELAAHRENADCAACHDRMDPLGFALDRFDPVGKVRDTVDGVEIDTSAVLPGGRQIDGLGQLLEALADDPRFLRSLQKRLFIYGVGREPLATEVREMQVAAGEDPSLSDLVTGVIASKGFRLRGGPPSATDDAKREPK